MSSLFGNRSGFTLVELIVVITILAILSGVASASYLGFSAQARDARRDSEVSSIQKAIVLHEVGNNRYPEPGGNVVTLTMSGTPVMKQGEITPSLAREINFSGNFSDPLDGSGYTYSTDMLNSRYTIAARTEGMPGVGALSMTSLLNGDTRYLSLHGDSLGVLLTSDRVPLEKTSATSLDIFNATGSYYGFTSDLGFILGSGSVLRKMSPKYDCPRLFTLGYAVASGSYIVNKSGTDASAYCNANTPSANFFSWIDDGDFEDASSTSWDSTKKVTATPYEGQYVLQYTAYSAVSSSSYVKIDSSKRYRLSGYFRSAGTIQSKIFYGFYEYDENLVLIQPDHVYTLASSDSSLANPAVATDTVLVVNKPYSTYCSYLGTHPTFGTYFRFAFNTSASGSYSDLPNRDLTSSYGFASIVDNGSTCSVTLKAALGRTYPAGTNVRVHLPGGTFNYIAAVNSTVPNTWSIFSGTVQGESLNGLNNIQFRHGTRYIRPALLVNYTQTGASTLQMDNLRWEQY